MNVRARGRKVQDQQSEERQELKNGQAPEVPVPMAGLIAVSSSDRRHNNLIPVSECKQQSTSSV